MRTCGSPRQLLHVLVLAFITVINTIIVTVITTLIIIIIITIIINIADMWSLGVICYILLSGFSPFMGDNDQVFCKSLKQFS